MATRAHWLDCVHLSLCFVFCCFVSFILAASCSPPLRRLPALAPPSSFLPGGLCQESGPGIQSAWAGGSGGGGGLEPMGRRQSGEQQLKIDLIGSIGTLPRRRAHSVPTPDFERSSIEKVQKVAQSTSREVGSRAARGDGPQSTVERRPSCRDFNFCNAVASCRPTLFLHATCPRRSLFLSVSLSRPAPHFTCNCTQPSHRAGLCPASTLPPRAAAARRRSLCVRAARRKR